MNDLVEANGHLDDRLREIALGLLPDDETDAALTHLASCADCAEQVRLARTVYETGLAEGRAHVVAEKLVAHAERDTPLSAPERTHLDGCTDCRADLELLAGAPPIAGLSFGAGTSGAQENPVAARAKPRGPADARGGTAPSPGGPVETAVGRPRFSMRRWGLGSAFALAAAAVAFLLLTPPERIATDGFIRAAAIEVQLPRGAVEPESFEAIWIAALGDYAAGRYGAAEGGLRRALELDPTHAEAKLFLGSSVLLQDRTKEALDWFDAALEGTPGERVRYEAEWQRIVARLSSGSLPEREFEGLTMEVEALASKPGLHAREAQEVVARIRARRARER